MTIETPGAPVPADPPADPITPDSGVPGAPVAPPADAPPATGTILQPVEPPKPLTERIPAKYHTLKDDGTLDLEATLIKSDDARAALEKRFGTGDVRPKSADEYRLELPDELKPIAATLPEEGIKAFQQKVFAEGMTQKQYEFVMREYLSVAPQLVQGARAVDMTAAVAALQTEWPDEQVYKRNIGAAQKAVIGFGGSDATGILTDYGNDPRIVRMMARIGSEMGEDRAPGTPGAISPDTVDSLRASEAYRDAKHPDHAKVSAQVADAMQRQYGRDRMG